MNAHWERSNDVSTLNYQSNWRMDIFRDEYRINQP